MDHSAAMGMEGKQSESTIEVDKAGTQINTLGVHSSTSHDPNWTGADVNFSGVDEAKVLRKMDLRLIPVLALLYLLSFLDRGRCLANRNGLG